MPASPKKASEVSSTEPLSGPVATRFTASKTGGWRTQRPEVNFADCAHCGICAEYCPTGVIVIRKDQPECVVVDWEYCKGCGVCADLCPHLCITMSSEGGSRG